MQEERGKSAVTDNGRVASCSKAICATVLAIAAEESQHGRTPRRMTFDDPAFQFIPWAQPLSDPRKSRITVKQLLNHTSGICPEAIGAPNDGTWDYILGHTDDARTKSLAFDPGTGCGYSTHALDHAALVCENVTGQPYDRYAIEMLFRPLGIETWWFQYYDGGPKYGRHPSHGVGMPARDMARIAYCMAHGGRWNGRQVIPKWFVDQTAAPTHDVRGLEMRFHLNAQTFSHGWELPAVVVLKPPVFDSEWLKQGLDGEPVVRLAGHVLAHQCRVVERVSRVTTAGARIERESSRSSIARVTQDVLPASIVGCSGCLGADAGRVVEQLLDRDPGLARVAQRLGPGDELEGAIIEAHLARSVTLQALLRRDRQHRGADGFRAGGNSP